MSVGFVALARPTFDVPFAESTARAAHHVVGSAFAAVEGGPDLLLDPESATARAKDLSARDLDALIVLQATFADSSLLAAVADAVDRPLVLWAVPEPRTGQRLRLNSFCGINLAGYVLARRERPYRWVYRHPNEPEATGELVTEAGRAGFPTDVDTPDERRQARTAVDETLLAGATVGLIGQRPDGFEPCDYDADALRSLTGVQVDSVPLPRLFAAGEAASDDEVSAIRDQFAAALEGIDEVDQTSLERSIRIHLGLADLASARGWHGAATRCWPECFTEFGGAACSAMALLTSQGTPSCCEADVYGNVTALLLKELSGEPPFVADLVDLHRQSGTGTFWHCGLAPIEMAAGEPRATIHSNRQKPLLNEFPLRPGPITIARLSQSRNQHRLVVGSAEMLDEPLPFSGTAGVARFDRSVDAVLDTIMEEGLEHHYGLAYGDHRSGLAEYAAAIGIPVVEL